MKNLTLDLSSVPDSALLPEGTYPFMIEKVELRDSTTPGNAPYLNFTLQVLAEGFENRKLFTNMSLGEKSLWRVKLALGALGMDKNVLNLTVDDSNLVLSPTFVGKVGLAVVGTELYKRSAQDAGRLQNVVTDILPIESDQPAPAAPAATPVALPPSAPIPAATAPVAHTPPAASAPAPKLKIK